MNWFEGKKMVVPIDFGRLSQQAVDKALTIADRPEQVYVVHVLPDLLAMSPPAGWANVADEHRATEIETAFQKQYSENKYQKLSFEVLFGDPGQSIVEYAEKIGANVIVMPSHGRSGLERLLLGSVAERVLRLAHCPVLILRK